MPKPLELRVAFQQPVLRPPLAQHQKQPPHSKVHGQLLRRQAAHQLRCHWAVHPRGDQEHQAAARGESCQSNHRPEGTRAELLSLATQGELQDESGTP